MAFRTKTFSWTHTGSFMSYGVADFNDDGVLDLAYGGPVTPFRNQANPFHIISVDRYGNISNSDAIFASVPSAVHHAEMVVGDFNGDGRPDFFSANTGFDAPPSGASATPSSCPVTMAGSTTCRTLCPMSCISPTRRLAAISTMTATSIF